MLEGSKGKKRKEKNKIAPAGSGGQVVRSIENVQNKVFFLKKPKGGWREKIKGNRIKREGGFWSGGGTKRKGYVESRWRTSNFDRVGKFS